ncbi:copper resistance protein CopB [Sphingomonas spermidinifaciens]|uniref:Copper resistance protein CopB n=2 Tax=Sphingomonas spermidinifaciens TaxID=1141889 RepID=A0A2A4B8A8_9SPHN|nr:copper resistance protein CopB [Sphingomonas spermidinifaciens]
MGHCAMPAPVKPKAATKPKAVTSPPRPKPAADPSAAPAAGTADPACAPEHAAMGHCTPKTSAPAAQAAPPSSSPAAPADPDCPAEHAAMGHCTPKQSSAKRAAPAMGMAGTALPAGNAPAPAAPEASYADRIWGREAMAPARAALRREHGGMSFSQLMLNLAEVQLREGRDGYRWDGEFWYGGDINRLTIKSEGEGTFREDAEGEVQALYSRAIGPYFNLQAGVRQDFAPGPDRTYAQIGFEGLAPYWFDVEGALFLSDKGDVFARLEGYYDQRITQRLVLQPRVELNLSAQDVPDSRLGSGVTDAEAGLRLRYEIAREFAPYVGVSWERRLGETARYARAAGEGTGGFSLVAGIRAWF